ncbi:hypothetical protein NQ317_013982 [Molorchus minor]|uniref:Uncharacterized protein n=1 Tax=Molorchus minor TaxID=1323400 RepID=A0ABQ9JAM9_9CUCU|nr:hypothetical protein NQ317_013982 [Molorchus minor]
MKNAKMSLDNEDLLSVEEVERALSEIEKNKYSPVKCTERKDYFEGTLTVLSKEFDSLGLPTIDLAQPMPKVFKQVVSNARSLVHIHRSTLSNIKDLNIENKCKDTTQTELHKIIDNYKLKVIKYQEKISMMENQMIKLKHEKQEEIQEGIVLKEELGKNKRYHTSKQNELHRHIKKLTKENNILRESLDKEIGIYRSKDDIVLELLRKYKTNEEIFQSTIKRLQENNRELLNEILDMKSQQILDTCSNNQGCSS